MKVVESKDHSWFLFEHEGYLYLDTNCSLSAVGYSFMIQLDDVECESYRTGGYAYLSELANNIEDSVPILPDSTSFYKNRRVPCEVSDLTTDAVRAWREYRIN